MNRAMVVAGRGTVDAVPDAGAVVVPEGWESDPAAFVDVVLAWGLGLPLVDERVA